MKLILSIIMSLGFCFSASADQCQKELKAVGDAANAVALRLAGNDQNCINDLKAGKKAGVESKCPAATWKAIETAIKQKHFAEKYADACINYCADTEARLTQCMSIIDRENMINSGSDAIRTQIQRVNYEQTGPSPLVTRDTIINI